MDVINRSNNCLFIRIRFWNSPENYSMKLVLVFAAILFFMVMTVVLRHALMILPFIATVAYLYWDSGKNDDENIVNQSLHSE